LDFPPDIPIFQQHFWFFGGTVDTPAELLNLQLANSKCRRKFKSSAKVLIFRLAIRISRGRLKSSAAGFFFPLRNSIAG
jgi:hypothetical protein